MDNIAFGTHIVYRSFTGADKNIFTILSIEINWSRCFSFVGRNGKFNCFILLGVYKFSRLYIGIYKSYRVNNPLLTEIVE